MASGVYVRQNINGNSPQDIKGINDNMMALWQKVFGDINLSDVQKDIKNLLFTNWLQPQGEGNTDSSHPMYIRFYIPDTTKTIKSAKLNAITSRYRVDSDVTDSNEQTTIAQTVTSSAGGYSEQTSSSGGGGAETSSGGGNHRHKVLHQTDIQLGDPSAIQTTFIGTTDGNPTAPIDQMLCRFDIDQYSANKHLYTYDASGDHTHSVNISPHSHSVATPSHTHNVTLSVTVAAHTHNLNMGIKEASTAPNGVDIYINDNHVGNQMNGDNQVQNDVDISTHLNIGSWNVIKVTSSAISRVTVYGIVELIQKYT